MKKLIFATIIVLNTYSLSLSCMEDIPKEVMDLINNQRIEGIDNIADQKFKNDLLAYLYFNGNRKYKKLYYYLSKSFLSRHFKNIKNADEYAEEMRDSAERGDREYIEVFKPIYLNKREVKLKIMFKANSEGVDYTYERIEFFIPVPLHWSRRLIRGYNQSHVLVKKLNEPVARINTDLVRIRHTKSQVGMTSSSARIKNVADAFAVRVAARSTP